MAVQITGMGIITPEKYLMQDGFKEWENPGKVIPPIKSSFFKREYPRYSRYDSFSKLGCAAATLAIENSGIPESEIKGDRTGIILGTMTGSIGIDIKHLKRIFSKDISFASPQIFSFTLPSTCIGEISILYGITGTDYIINSGYTSGLSAIFDGVHLIESGEMDYVIAGGLDSIPIVLVENNRIWEGNVSREAVPSAFIFFLEKREIAVSRNAENFGELSIVPYSSDDINPPYKKSGYGRREVDGIRRMNLQTNKSISSLIMEHQKARFPNFISSNFINEILLRSGKDYLIKEFYPAADTDYMFEAAKEESVIFFLNYGQLLFGSGK